MKPKSEEFDQEWAVNAYAHSVWKLNSYQRIVKNELLNVENIVYNCLKRYKREFCEGKKSFFQRII